MTSNNNTNPLVLKNEAGLRGAALRAAAEKARASLARDGYAVVPGVVDAQTTAVLLGMFRDWRTAVPGATNAAQHPHGIIKHFRVGGAGFVWQARALTSEFWRVFHGTPDVTTSLDGACFIARDDEGGAATAAAAAAPPNPRVDWTHTDQALNDSTPKCVQGLLSLTSNAERTFYVWPGTHRLHAEYATRVTKPAARAKKFCKIDPAYLTELRSRGHAPVPVTVPAGAVVLWDSRTFHSNCNPPSSREERAVVYVCMLPRKHKKNSAAMKRKRRRYAEAGRTTSHWPYPINVNPLQPNTFRNPELRIDYSQIPPAVGLPPKETIDNLLE